MYQMTLNKKYFIIIITIILITIIIALVVIITMSTSLLQLVVVISISQIIIIIIISNALLLISLLSSLLLLLYKLWTFWLQALWLLDNQFFDVVFILQNAKILPSITLGTYFQSGEKLGKLINAPAETKAETWFPSKLKKNGCLSVERFETALLSSIILVWKKLALFANGKKTRQHVREM